MKNGYFAAHLHIHSCFESGASMKGHMFQAKKLGLDGIWFTDHDYRMGKKEYSVNGFDFSAGSLVLQEGFGRSYGFSRITEEGSVEISDEQSLDGKYSMKLSIAGEKTGRVPEKVSADFFSSGGRHMQSLLSGVTIETSYYLTEYNASDTRLVFDICLSQQPPDFKRMYIRYVAGAPDGLQNAISLPSRPNIWHHAIFLLSEDCFKFPLGGLDNVFDRLTINLETEGGGAVAYIGSFRINCTWQFEEVRQRQREEAERLGRQFGLAIFVGNEISQAGRHKNSFSTSVPVINYAAAAYNVSHQDAVNWVKKHGGIFSVNHPFDEWKRMELNLTERDAMVAGLAKEYIKTRCDGAALIEVGFPEGKNGFGLHHYLQLWDILSRAGVFITGYGCSDNHLNDKGWFEGNNFAAYIFAPESSEESLLASMKSGNLYTADPVWFNGSFSFRNAGGGVMGQIVDSCSGMEEVLLSLDDLRPGAMVRWILDGIVEKETKANTAKLEETFLVKIPEGLHFLRVELYNDAGRCILLTNPIYFTRNIDMEIPPERRFVRNGRMPC
jgi:hypothetical protein